MTGELSLNGLVLPIGGCKEKILAAQREGLKRLIFPEKNRAQVQKLSSEVKEGIEIIFVQEYADVFRVLFPDVI
jgi:ATP-dependent Lon protease